MCILVYMYVCGCVPLCVYTCVCVSSCVRLRVAAFWIRLVGSGPIAGDPDPIRIGVRYGPGTLAIRRPTYRMIRRSGPVRAVKTKQRFGSKIASFHVSVCFCFISLFTVVICICGLLLSFHVTI